MYLLRKNGFVWKKYFNQSVFLVLYLLFSMYDPLGLSAGLLNRLGSSSPMNLGMAGAGDTAAISPGAGNVALNPAGLSTLEQFSLYLGDVSVWTDFAYEQSIQLGGQHFEALDEVFQFPEMAMAYRLNDQWIIGAEFWAPYGLSANFNTTSLTFPGFQSEFVNIQAAFALAYQWNDDLAFAASINVDYIDLDFRFPTFMNDTFLGPNFSDANGFDVGASLGILWTPERWRFGVKYSFPSSVDLDGKTIFPSLFPVPQDSFNTTIKIPQRIALGIAYEWTDGWMSAVDGSFTDYNENNHLNLVYDTLPLNSIPLSWESVWSIHLGNRFQVTDKVTWKQGIGWQSSAAPDATLIPSIPDTPGWIVSTGVGYQWSKNLQLDWSLSYAWGDRSIGFSPSRASSGRIESDIWLVGLAIDYHF